MILSSLSFAPAQADDGVQVENWPVFRPGEASAFVEPSMALDGDGIVHLAYAYAANHSDQGSRYQEPALLRYAVLKNNTWSFSDLGDVKIIQSVTMAVGGSGQPHIICRQQANYTTWELVHWHETNGTWSSETVRTFSHTGVTDVNVLIDSNDSVHLACSVSLGDFTYKTHVHMTNAGGDWTTDELATVRSSYAVWTNPPQLAFDGNGRLHMAYLNVADYDVGDWYSGNHSIEFVTLENGEWGDRQVLNVGTLNRFSFGVDTDGYESVLYQQTDQMWFSGGKVRLAMRYDFGWSYKPYDEDGTSSCKLIMDGDEEKVLILRGNLLFRSEYYANNWIEQPLWVPDGMSIQAREFAAGTWDHLVLLYYDTITQSIAVAKEGAHMDIVPPALSLAQDGLEVTVNWEPVSYDAAYSCVIIRSGGASFVQQVGAYSFVDDTFNDGSWRQTYVYRMSVITPEGEEYVGPLADIWMEPESDPWAPFGVLLAVLVVVAMTAVILWFLKREKLTG
ncbi:MAG: hypothetical protein AB9819_05215 [Methanomassiliicoccales archaeon]